MIMLPLYYQFRKLLRVRAVLREAHMHHWVLKKKTTNIESLIQEAHAIHVTAAQLF